MASNLDDEIEELQARVATLKRQLRVHASTLITAPSTRQLLSSSPSDKPAISLTLPTHSGQDQAQKERQSRQALLTDALAQQEAHAQQCLYRACATLTTFRARDPDPRAVDGGAILGLRIEVFSRSRFLRPYYVLMNRPFPDSRHLRVHRHTLPACIPLAGLAWRYLPPPPPSKSSKEEEDEGRAGGGKRKKKQDLAKFARALRREVVRYHHRLGVVADLRKAAGIGKTGQGEGGPEDWPNRLVEIAPADAEAKQLTIEWADGRTGRLVMGDDGEIVKLVVLGENGWDREAGRDLLGGAARIEDVVKRLATLT